MSDQQKIIELSDTFKRVLDECPEVVYIGNKILRKKTEEVSLEDGLKIGGMLKDVLTRHRNITGYGRGLAAPQIGKNKSVFVTFVDDIFKIYINPKIVSSSKNLNLYRESCLSCGYLSVDVKRPSAVTIEYLSESGDIKTEEAKSFLARLLQHEYDHLEGIVNVDKAEAASIEFMTNDPLQEKLREVGE
jgi:peptide deformylase